MILKQNQTAQALIFLMVDSTDHITGKTGLSPTVTLSKNGGTFASPAGAVTEIANGWYKVAGNATDSNTLGSLALHASATGADATDMMFDVVAYDMQDAVRLGLTALPNAAAGANGGLPLSVDASGRVDVLKINGTSQTARDLGASVLLSPGTGTGQLDITSGVVKANLVQILASAITGTAANIVGAFTKFFDKATPTGTINSLPDAVAGAIGGVAIVGSAMTLAADQAVNVTKVGGTTQTAGDLVPLISGIGTAGGAAINQDVSADNASGAIDPGSTLKVGTQTGTFANTSVLDGVYHRITNATNVIDWVYKLAISGSTTPISLTWTGYFTNAGKTMTVQAWKYTGTPGWETIGIIAGQNGSANIVKNLVLYARHCGTVGAEIGNVYLRFVTANGVDLYTDQLYMSYSITSRSVGYANGAIWANTVGGTAGVIPYTNGTADKPSLLWADALTLSASVGLKKFQIANGSTITFSATLANYSLEGFGWALTGAVSRDISGTTIKGCENLTGLFTMDTQEGYWHDCQIGACTIGEVDIHTSHITGLITLNAEKPFLIHRSVFVNIDGTQGVDFGSTADTRRCVIAKTSGMLTVKNMKAGNILDIDGDCDLTLDSTCTAGTVYINGCIRLTNNGSGQTIVDTSRYNESLVRGAMTTQGYTAARSAYLDLLNNAIAELTTDPGATPTPTQATMMLYMHLRNQLTQGDPTEASKYQTIANDAGTTILRATVSDDGSLFTKGKFATP